ncbi:MAG: hypothetical protein KBG48_11445 [Kofleriaceae bacterium]|nr:hypothetical protein [Kofleriaceae bacterium]MBP9167999.1 hypothetical protein [Kofleriaceae bacterium]MBP9856833.1 hypothetical protein [Kofleriaceae bacterium]
MTDYALHYYDDNQADPRNAAGMFMPFAPGQRPPRILGPVIRPRPVQATPIASAAVAAPMAPTVPTPIAAYPYPYPAPTYGAPVYGAPMDPTRRALRDLSLREVLPLVVRAISALRALPTAPPELPGETNVGANVINGARFMNALAGHAKSAQQLDALADIGAAVLA